jgi:flagellar basal body-associated protein FliL
MYVELLLAAADHGPGRHGAVVNVILVILVVFAVAAGVVRVVRSRKRSAKESERDQGRGG